LNLQETLLKKKAKAGLTPYTTEPLKLLLDSAFNRKKESLNPTVLALRNGLPVIIGRKCEPFCEFERETNSTHQTLELLKDYDVPTVVETKVPMFFDRYYKILSEMKAGVNVTITPGDDELSKKLSEPSSYSERWRFVRELKDVGLWVGITGEPIISGVNDDTFMLEEWADNAFSLKVSHVNFGDFRISNLKLTSQRMKQAGFDITQIVAAKKRTWIQKGKEIFRILHKRNLLATSPDWINFGLINDTESCCGFNGLTFKFHCFTFQHALLDVKRNRRTRFNDVFKHNIFGDSVVGKFRDIWNGKSGYFNLSDVKGVSKIGYDGEGNVIYGVPRGLKEAFN